MVDFWLRTWLARLASSPMLYCLYGFCHVLLQSLSLWSLLSLYWTRFLFLSSKSSDTISRCQISLPSFTANHQSHASPRSGFISWIWIWKKRLPWYAFCVTSHICEVFTSMLKLKVLLDISRIEVKLLADPVFLNAFPTSLCYLYCRLRLLQSSC